MSDQGVPPLGLLELDKENRVRPVNRIVAMTEYRGNLFVATETGVWVRGDDGVFRPCRFEVENGH